MSFMSTVNDRRSQTQRRMGWVDQTSQPTRASFRIASPGSPPEVVAPIGSSGAAQLVVDGDALFYTDAWTGNVARVPKAGGAPTTLASGQQAPVGIAADAWCVYWVNSGSGIADGQVMNVAR
jgi:hypothetical protein